MKLNHGLNNDLKERVHIQKASQDFPSAYGGVDRTYTTLDTLWAGIKSVKPGQYIRGVQVADRITTLFKFRNNSLRQAIQKFAGGTTTNDVYLDFARLKSDMFIFMTRGVSTVGRLFRVRELQDIDEERIMVWAHCEEIEEQGVGYNADR